IADAAAQDHAQDHPGHQPLKLVAVHRSGAAPEVGPAQGAGGDPPGDGDADQIGHGIPAQREGHAEDGDREDIGRDVGEGDHAGLRASALDAGGGWRSQQTGGLVKPRSGAHIGTATGGPAMQTRNKFLDDISQLMTNAMGVAQGAKTEAETAMQSLVDRWMAVRDFVTREEFDAVRAMAQKAREENEALKARLDALEAAGAKKKG